MTKGKLAVHSLSDNHSTFDGYSEQSMYLIVSGIRKLQLSNWNAEELLSKWKFGLSEYLYTKLSVLNMLRNNV